MVKIKANQKFKEFSKNKSGAGGIIGIVLSGAILILVASALMPTIANQSTVASDSADTDSKTDTMIDLWPFGLALAVFVALFTFIV